MVILKVMLSSAFSMNSPLCALKTKKAFNSVLMASTVEKTVVYEQAQVLCVCAHACRALHVCVWDLGLNLDLSNSC